MNNKNEKVIKTWEEDYTPSTAAGVIADVLSLGSLGKAVDALANPNGETRYYLQVGDKKEVYNSKQERDNAIKKIL